MVWREIRNSGIRIYNDSLKLNGSEREDLQRRAEILLKISINCIDNVANESWYYLGRIAEDRHMDNEGRESTDVINLEEAVRCYKNAVMAAVSYTSLDYRDVITRIVDNCLKLGNRTKKSGDFTRTYLEVAQLELLEGGYGIDLTKPTSAWKLLLLAKVEKAIGKHEEANHDLESALENVRGDNIEDLKLKGDIYTEKADIHKKMGNNWAMFSAYLSSAVYYARINTKTVPHSAQKEIVNPLLN